MATLDEQITTLQFFNEKTKKLLGLSFIQAITDPNASVKISGQLSEDGSYKMSSEVKGPSSEAIDAFVLTFRYFIQNNETISLKNIADLYDIANVDTKLKGQFKSARKAINDMLDSPNFMNLTYNGTAPTNREVMLVFIYGDLAHGNDRQKRQLYKEWMSIPPAAALLQSCFNLILGHFLDAIVYISYVNENALKQLEAQKI